LFSKVPQTRVISFVELSPKNTFYLPARIKEGILALELACGTLETNGFMALPSLLKITLILITI